MKVRSSAMSESMNVKIAKLLRLAERAGTPEEAANASRAAERLMTKWGIEEAMIRSHMGADEKPEAIVTKYTSTFPKTFIKPRTHVACAVVRGMGNMRPYLITLGNGTQKVAIMGYESDVDRALILAESILKQADSAMASWWKSYPYRTTLSAADAKKAKRQFIYSFAIVVQDRLAAMREEEINASASSGEPGTALVLLDRDKAVQAEYDKMSLRKGRGVKGSAHGLLDGRAAGARASLGGSAVGSGGRRALGG